MTVDLSTEVCGIKLRNPLVLASGILGVDAASLKRVVENGAGAVTTKSCSLKPRKGNNNPTVVAGENYLLNAVGLSNPGVEEYVKELKQAVKEIKAPVFASIFSFSVEEYGELASRISEAKPALLEVNISCPNTEGKIFACDKRLAAEVTKAVKDNSGRVPISIKLSPNVPDIKEIARAVAEAGADCITVINTVPAMAVNLEARTPVLANKVGGLSGPVIKPIALKAVFDVCSAVEIPVIGLGGVSNGRDALEFISVGATAVGVGSAVYFRGEKVFAEICGEMQEWMRENNVKNLKKLRSSCVK